MFSRPVVLRTNLFVCGVFVCSALLWFSQLSASATESVTLAWNPSTDSTIVGYKIHYGILSHVYTDVVTVGKTNAATISGLLPGVTYYFAAASFNAAGVESSLSNEASYAVPLSLPLPRLTSAVRSAGAFSFTVAGISGQKYVVQASTNLQDWIPVQTNMAPFSFIDRNAAKFSQRYYRTMSL